MIVFLTASYIYISNSAQRERELQEYRKYYDLGITYFSKGREYLSQAKTTAELGDYKQAALLSTSAKEGFKSASIWFERAERTAYNPSPYDDVELLSESEKQVVTNYLIERRAPQPVVTNISPKGYSDLMADFSEQLSDDLIKAERERGLLRTILDILGKIFLLVP